MNKQIKIIRIKIEENIEEKPTEEKSDINMKTKSSPKKLIKKRTNQKRTPKSTLFNQIGKGSKRTNKKCKSKRKNINRKKSVRKTSSKNKSVDIFL